MMIGDPLELKWNRKGLLALDRAIGRVGTKNVAVQAGGCLGVFPKHLAREFKTVYTFEPSTQFVKMTANAPQDNIIRFQAALGDKQQMVDPVCSLAGYEGKTVLHVGMTVMREGGSVPTIRLDDLGLPVVNLLYLDIEGWELYALRGAVDTIKRCRPVIGCELNSAIGRVGFSTTDVRDLLQDLGYKFEVRTFSDEVFVPC